jgi:hypothetical protein
MNDDKGDAPVDGGESQRTWPKGRPKPKDLTSRQGITDDRWTWLGRDSGPAPEQRRFGRSLAKAGLVVSAAAFFGGLVLLAISVGNNGDAQVVALHPTSSSPATATAPARPLATTSTVPASPLATKPAAGFQPLWAW